MKTDTYNNSVCEYFEVGDIIQFFDHPEQYAVVRKTQTVEDIQKSRVLVRQLSNGKESAWRSDKVKFVCHLDNAHIKERSRRCVKSVCEVF